jgi:hypothetical protein
VSDNWIVENIQNALSKWSEYLDIVWTLLTTPPQDFRGGGIWSVILNIHGAVQAIALGLLVLFFLVGVVKTCGTFAELKRPEVAVKLFVRFIIAKALITYGLNLMLTLFSVVQGVINTIMRVSGVMGSGGLSMPSDMIATIEGLGFLASIPLWAVSLIICLVIWVLSIIVLLTVYGRFFKIYIYTAIAPIPLSSFAGEPTQSVGVSFLKSYCAVLLEGAVIILACVIFSLFAASPPVVDSSASAVTQVWSYFGELILNMLILVGVVKMADRLIREMMGLG